MIEAEQRWVDQAKYDLDTAQAMLDACRYMYVLFCCQQAVEKALKAKIVGLTGELPPRIHNLLRLSEKAGIDLQVEMAQFFGELSDFYVQSRYPEEISAIGAKVSRDIATEILSKTEEVIQWLLSASK